MDRRQLLQGTAAVAVSAAWRGVGDRRTGSLGEPQPLDGRPLPAYDYTRANRLPREMTGYWTKSFALGGRSRTAKVYISPETPIRSYFTVIAVPQGADTAQFLQTSGWIDIADRREEALFVLEPGEDGWGDAATETDYVTAAMAFFQNNGYFSIFGLHYFVGYGAGAPPLEAWSVAHPLRVIGQVYVDSPGLGADYLNAYAAREFDGQTDTGYTTVVFPAGFRLIRYDEVVVPTWFINPDPRAAASLAYWKHANDVTAAGRADATLGTVFRQRRDSGRWMTSYAGPISQVAVGKGPVRAGRIAAFLISYTRYENFFAYSNQLFERADLARLGVQVRTMTVAGYLREYLVYVPRTARRRWGGGKAPVVFVWPGNSQTDKVFFDAAQWWKVAEREGVILVTFCEQYSNSPVSVSHRDSLTFYRQVREVLIDEYPADSTRFYSTGQSAGSQVTQSFAIAFPEYFAAVASTSFAAAPDAAGSVTMDGVAHPASWRTIPCYLIYGYGDLAFLAGDLWDGRENSLDQWARYHLTVNGLELADEDRVGGTRSGWHHRFQTWTWRRQGSAIPVLRLTKNLYRSHNTMPEESPLLWDFLRHYSREIDGRGNVVRYYSKSGFRSAHDRRRL
jgi:poly(3-hydroxybutyrate) depolymerase